MAKFYSVGTSDQFYSRVTLPPELRFDGNTGNMTLVPTQFNSLSIACSIATSNTNGDIIGGGVGSNFNLFKEGNGLFVRCKNASNGYENLVLGLFISGSHTYSFEYDGNYIKCYIDGVLKATSTAGVKSPDIATICIGSAYNDYCQCTVYSINIDGYSYIQQGDQSAGTLVPSHPSGADGTLVGGASWQYTGIVGNYLTVALAVSAITASAPTEPITIYILDRSTDVSGIPAEINGQPVYKDYSFAGGKKNGLINFGFGFNL